MKSILSIAICLSLTSCAASDSAFWYPEVNILNGQKVDHISPEKSVTFVGSTTDEFNRNMPVYPHVPQGNAHKIIHISPSPKYIFATCESTTYDNMSTTTRTGHQLVTGSFQEGKTYQLYCNAQYDNSFEIVAREVPNGTSFLTSYAMDTYFKREHTNTSGRVRFIATGETKNGGFMGWGTNPNTMNILGLDNKLSGTAELIAPVNRVIVSCKRNGRLRMVDIKYAFQTGKTYRLDCREDANGEISAFIADVQ